MACWAWASLAFLRPLSSTSSRLRRGLVLGVAENPGHKSSLRCSWRRQMTRTARSPLVVGGRSTSRRVTRWPGTMHATRMTAIGSWTSSASTCLGRSSTSATTAPAGPSWTPAPPCWACPAPWGRGSCTACGIGRWSRGAAAAARARASRSTLATSRSPSTLPTTHGQRWCQRCRPPMASPWPSWTAGPRRRSRRRRRTCAYPC
mmetsp:Transcript_100736/g.325100  ORF Transcript_100736/g.325100 Transcript_100736/m.325100 type:complete len:204 (-) Transcript_100736:271-882(-)